MISVPVTEKNQEIFLELKELDVQFRKCKDSFLRLSIIVKANALCEKLELEQFLTLFFIQISFLVVPKF